MRWLLIKIFNRKQPHDKTVTNNPVYDPEEDIKDGWILLVGDSQKVVSVDEVKPGKTKSTNKIIELNIKPLIKSSHLTVSNEDKICIFRDVFTNMSSSWLRTVKKFANINKSEWHPTSSQKNVLGGMIDIANYSCPNKLSPLGLTQALKAAHVSITNSLPQTLSEEQSMELLDMIIKSAPHIIDIWTRLAK